MIIAIKQARVKILFSLIIASGNEQEKGTTSIEKPAKAGLWCSNTVQPPLPKLYDIAEYLQVEVSDLLISKNNLIK